jgi:hypothetical protein
MLCVCNNNGYVLYNELVGLEVSIIKGRLKNSFQTA